MTFMFVLALATFVAAIGSRIRTGVVRWRRAARHGLGVAFVAAGVGHLVESTPFEQHLPGWIPAAAAIVAVTGIIEIALGLTLVTARRAMASVGVVAVVFLVAVFPANVYVAVADVDVDGLPGGVYRWLRLPLQAVFAAWAWTSTRGPQVPRTERDIAAQSDVLAAGASTRGSGGVGRPTVAQASVLRLRRSRDVLPFMLAALRLKASFAASPGAIEMSLRAAPIRRTFWTLSHWRSDDDRRAFVSGAAHVEVMHRFGPAIRSSDFVRWYTTHDRPPTWDDAVQRIADNEQR